MMELVRDLLARSGPVIVDQPDCEDEFEPWRLFPAVYGTYSEDFDRCMIAVLEEVRDGRKEREDLAAEIFREMLCTAGLCAYGTSPRVCFATPEFRLVLPELIDRWKFLADRRWD